MTTYTSTLLQSWAFQNIYLIKKESKSIIINLMNNQSLECKDNVVTNNDVI